ncbi:unnamed protein product [Fusarium graminearum]|nr:unnamed protein product [Fusarium graminearum]
MHISHEKYKHAPVIIHDGHDKVALKLLRQLGMHLDKGLTFKTQIEMGISSHCSMTNDLERTLQDRFGAPLKVVQEAIRSVIVQKRLYGSEIWWPGPNKAAAKRANGA